MAKNNLKLLVLATTLVVLAAACGGGGSGGGDTQLPINTPDGTSGSSAKEYIPAITVPTTESFADCSVTSDSAAARWLKNCYYPLPRLTSSASVYQNASTKAWADQIYSGINSARVAAGLPALVRNDHMDAVAQAQARDMALRNYFGHTNGEGMTFLERIQAIVPPPFDHCGENAARGQETAQEAITGWLNSEKHRKNIMNGNYTHSGIGVYYDPADKEMPVHLIQVFVQFVGDPGGYTDWIGPGLPEE